MPFRLKIILIFLSIFFNFLIKLNFFWTKSNFLKQRQLIFYNYKYFTIFKFFETFYKKTSTKTFFSSTNFKLNKFKWFFLKFYFLSHINFYNIFFKRFFFKFKNNFHKSYNNRLFLNLLFLKNSNHSSFLNKIFTNNLKNTVKLKKQLRIARLSNRLYILKKKKFYNRRTLYTKELIKEYRLLKNQKYKKGVLSNILKRLYVKRRRRLYISRRRKRKIKRRNRYLKNLNYFLKWSFALKNFFDFKLTYTYNFLFMYIFLKTKKKKLRKSLDFFKHFLAAKNYLKKRYKNKKYYCLLKKVRSNSFLTVINNFGDVIFYFSSGRLNLVTKKYKRSFAAIKLFWPLLVKRLKMLSIKNIIFLLDPGFRRSLYYISRLCSEHRLNFKYIPKSIKPHSSILNTKKLRRVKRK